jgi:hypothetical protein
LLAPHAAEHANVIFVSIGSVERYLGLLCGCLARRDEAEFRLRRAMDANREMRAVAWLARTQLDFVESRFAQSPQDAESRDLLAEAIATTARCDLHVLRERAERLASRA